MRKKNLKKETFQCVQVLMLIAAFLTLFLNCSFSTYAFGQRTSPPDYSSMYYDTSQNGYTGYSMPNCTAYAYGRVYEITGNRPDVSMNNANTFFNYNNSNHVYDSSTDPTEPRAGAIVCYGGTYGHVQVVESIGSDSGGQYIIASESNYSGRDYPYKSFNVVKIYTSDLNGYTAYDSSGTSHHSITVEFLEDNDGYAEDANANGKYSMWDVTFQGYIYATGEEFAGGDGENGSDTPTGGKNLYSYENNEDGTITITGLAKDVTGIDDPEIPSKINGKTVTAIGNDAFEDCYGLKGQLTIPATVTTIGYDAFRDCSGLTGSLTIPDGVKIIGAFAFENCSGFDGDLTIGEGVTTIERYAFGGCKGFRGSLNLGKGVTDIEYNAFENCIGFTGGLVIPDSVINIGSSAFYNCSGFDGTLKLGSSVRKIENSAFYGCDGFTGDLTIPDNVKSIGTHAFFWQNNTAGSLIIGNGVTEIASATFEDCTGFHGGLVLGNNITKIGEDAFRGCYNFKGSLTIPDSVKIIGSFAFDACSGFDGDLTIGDGVTTIERYAFAGCKSFSGNLELGKGLTDIEYNAFENCIGFTGSLVIPDSVINIGSSAFYKCSGFNGTLTLGNSVRKIDSNAFYGCDGFKGDLRIPDSVKSIGEQAFFWKNNTAGSLIIGNGMTEIANGAFENCTGFHGSLVLGNNITKIGRSAFDGCYNLSGSLTIPGNVQTIGDYAFYSCKGLGDSLTIPATVTSIGDDVFYNCSGIKTITNNSNVNIPAQYFLSAQEDCFRSQNGLLVGYEENIGNGIYTWQKGVVHVSDVSLNYDDIDIGVGKTMQLSATITPANAADKSVTWSSDNTAIASVDQNGLVTGISEGSTNIRVKTKDGDKQEICSVTVIAPEPDNKNNEENAGTGTENKTDNTGTEPENKPDNNTENTPENNPETQEKTIDATGIKLNKKSANIARGKTLTIKATISPASATNKSVTWKSSNTKVASVDKNGKIKAIKKGKAIITATTSNGKQATCKINVTEPVKSVKFGKNKYTVKKGNTITLKAVIAPKTASNKNVTWKSSNKKVATVDKSGKVKGIKKGTVTITVTTKDGKKTAKCKIVVK